MESWGFSPGSSSKSGHQASFSTLKGIVMSETKGAAVKKRKSLARGLIAGLIAGLAATAAKSLAERIFPPQPNHPPEQQAPGRRTHDGRNTSGACQGETERSLPLGTGRDGRRGLWRGRRVLPRGDGQAWGQLRPGTGGAGPRGSAARAWPRRPARDQTARERGSEITSYVVYGVTAELVRRLVRRWL